MLCFIAATGWSRIFLPTPTGLRVAHTPLIVDIGGRTLRFHLAKSNALYGSLDGGAALALIEGPNAYVSANWYADPNRHVPTWNYVAVEVEGPVKQLDASALAPLLDDLAAANEPLVGENWSRAAFDLARFNAMTGAIGAFEMNISAIRGTRKLSQNEPHAIAGLADGVAASGAVDLAALMRSAG
ncbi:MAG: FMN-binding negative transcriptional regulator [Pseudomonadota bacterium]|nr:FMN-binding negative transcriptional regulator [Pseudomonadota bacterium]